MSDDTGDAGELAETGAAPPARPPTEWSATDAIAYGVEVVKNKPETILVLGVGMLLMNGVSWIGQGIQLAANASGEDSVRALGAMVSTVLSLANVFVSAYVMMGFTRYILKVLRGQPAAMADLFGPGPYLQMLAAVVLAGVLTLVGCCLLVVPGVIFYLGIMLFAYVLIDQEKDAVEALKASWELTQGHKVGLFVYALLSILLSLAGLLLCGVGIFLTSAILSLGLGWIYMRLTGQEITRYAAD